MKGKFKIMVTKVYSRFCILIKKLRLYRRKKYWHNVFKKNISSKRLSKERKNEIVQFYKKYTKIDLLFHEFYYQKTGNFSKYYIPDDIYYTRIDPFFNDWDAAKYIDNKCYYDVIFPDVLQPVTIAKRIGNVYYDRNNVILSNEEIFKTLVLQQNLAMLYKKRA